MKVNSGSRAGMSPPKTTTFCPPAKESAAWCQIAWGTGPVADTFLQLISKLVSLPSPTVWQSGFPGLPPWRSSRKRRVWSPSQGSWLLSLQPPKTRMHGEPLRRTVQLEWRSRRIGWYDSEAKGGSDNFIFNKSRTATCKSAPKLQGLQPPMTTTKSFNADAVWPDAPRTFWRFSK